MIQPRLHGVGAEPESHVGVIGAQVLQRVRREVDDHQTPAGRQQAACFAYCAGGVVEEVQHLMDDNQIERVVDERWAVCVTLTQVDAAYLGAFEVGPGNGQHRMAAVEADGMHRLAAEQLEHPARAGTDVEERAIGVVPEHLDDRRFDVFRGCNNVRDPSAGRCRRSTMGRRRACSARS
jgi:hypothetical protein